MNRFRFFAVEETYCTPENCSYIAYAIYAEELTSQGWVHALSIPDVSCDKEFALHLADSLHSHFSRLDREERPGYQFCPPVGTAPWCVLV